MKNNYPYFLLFSFFFFLFSCSYGQYCTPVTAQYCCGFGITKVTFNSINNTSSNASVGYENFSTQQTSVSVGQNYSLFVKCDVPSEHNVKAWIDWNNDKIFDDVNEEVLTASQVFTYTGTIAIPSNALLNTPIRLRVAADYYLENPPTPCDSLVRGQAEDYTIIVVPNTAPPVAAFTADYTVSCSGVVQFTDVSTNLPTLWAWDFGDSSTSIQQNPAHTYNSSGIYTVTLIASNNNGSDTLVKYNYISVNLSGQLTPAACTPTTMAYCCNYGIYSVNFNTISKTSAGGIDSYKDYSCSNYTTVTEGMLYNLNVTTGPDNPEDLRVWIDLNNDGTLNDSSEKVFTSLNAKTHSGTLNIPAAMVHGVPLRMRFISESVGNPVSSCTNPLFGQTEDYGIIINQFTGLPTADFVADYPSTCIGVVNFTDQSYGLPASWFWNFGDGTTSTQQSPVHTYTTSGTYTVTLIVSNANGTDTIVKTNYISYNEGPVAANCTPSTINYCCGMGIYSVQFNSINNSSQDGIEGYKDYSCQVQTTLAANQSYTINIVTGIDYDENVRVWIDFNNSGSLNNATELVFSSDNIFTNHSGLIFIPPSVVTNKPLRMRITSDYGTSPIPLPCQNPEYGQVEDYTIIIVTTTNPPVSDFTVDSTNTCLGTVNFTDLSTNTPTSWLWNFGDGNTSTLKNPQHTYQLDGTYSVSLMVSNPQGNNTKTKNNYINRSTIYCAVGISEPAENSAFTIYPNPNDGKFSVVSNTEGQINLYNVLGENISDRIIISSGSDYRFELAAGIYFIHLEKSEGKTVVRKIIVEK